MTREKRAKRWAAEVYRTSNFVFDDKEGYDRFICDIECAYLQGAKDAEGNPVWRMCEDELPDKPCECVCHDGERMFFAEWVDDTPQGLRGWNINVLTAQPIAWLPLPKFNPKAE